MLTQVDAQKCNGWTTHLGIKLCLSAQQHWRGFELFLGFFIQNRTHLTQSAINIVISKIKDAWTSHWEAKKLELLQASIWQGDGGEGTSHMLQNLGESFQPELIATTVYDVNRQECKKYKINYVKMAMIRCGLLLNVNGHREETMLSRELHEVINKYCVNFDGGREGLLPTPRGFQSSPILAPLMFMGNIFVPVRVVGSDHAPNSIPLTSDALPRNGLLMPKALQ